jgi:ubiquinone/menaquinone biosynthesis C-methylase UbiE
LEVGIGTALVAVALSRPVVGIDISAEMLSRARQRLGPRVAQATVLELPFADGTFVAAYAVWLLHLLDDYPAVFAELHRVLAADGALVIEPARVPESDEIQDIVGSMYRQFGTRRDTEEGITTAAVAAGFKLQAVPTRPEYMYTSPRSMIESIESRAGAALWNLDDEAWSRIVEPVLVRLRALPDQDREREQQLRCPTIVLRKV